MVPWFRSQSCGNQDGCVERVFLVGGASGRYRTGGVGRHWAGQPIALGLAQEVVDGRAQQGAALLLLTHQLWRQTHGSLWAFFSVPPPGCRTSRSRVSVATQQAGIIKGKYCGKDQSVVPKGSDAIHARMRCFYMQLPQIHFAPRARERARH